MSASPDLNLLYLIPLCPLLGFCVALAIGFGWVQWQEARHYVYDARNGGDR